MQMCNSSHGENVDGKQHVEAELCILHDFFFNIKTMYGHFQAQSQSKVLSLEPVWVQSFAQRQLSRAMLIIADKELYSILRLRKKCVYCTAQSQSTTTSHILCVLIVLHRSSIQSMRKNTFRSTLDIAAFNAICN